MTWLSLCDTAIHEFSSLMWRNSQLTQLDLSRCEKLNIVGKKLSNDSGLESLRYLKLSGCTQINTLSMWFNLDGMRSLESLDLRYCCNLEALPENIQNNSKLEVLELDECRKLKSLPKLPASLEALRAINCIYLDTNSIQREMLENMLHRLRINNFKTKGFFCLLPGAEVPCEFDFSTAEASIVLPPIPKYGLSYFVFCVILPEGLNLSCNDVCVNIYDHGEKVVHWTVMYGGFLSGTLISDHVFLVSEYCNSASVDNDHYSLFFEVKTKPYYYYDDKAEWSTKGIKGCGVMPVFGLEPSSGLDGNSSSRSKVEIVELPFNAQVSDEFDVDENEDAQQQLLIIPTEKEEDLNDKSSCDCFIGLLLKHLLEESKRLFLLFSQAKR